MVEAKIEAKKQEYKFDPSMVQEAMHLRVIYNRKGCIGSGHCILSDAYDFAFDDEEFKAILKDGTELEGVQKGVWVKDVITKEPHLLLNAAKTCTPRVIAIIDLKTGKRIAP